MSRLVSIRKRMETPLAYFVPPHQNPFRPPYTLVYIVACSVDGS
jgi:hypothetical protein